MKSQLKIPATYMRGGTSKGVFFQLTDLPRWAQVPGAARDGLLLRVIGSPDPYGKQIDGMGGATSSTSKAVIVSKSTQPDHDVDYLFGQVSIDKPFVDWSGNCGNLTAAVGAFAISQGLVKQVPENGIARVTIWQVNTQKTIVVNIPMNDGAVQESGDFFLDGVAFPAAEVQVEFINPAAGAVFPTGQLVDELQVPGLGTLQATLINVGIPTVFLNAQALGLQGNENVLDAETLAVLATIRAHGALKMGLINDLTEAESRQHTPKIAFVAPPLSYMSSGGKVIQANEIDLLVRALSMGKLHHAMMGTAAVAIATAAAIKGTLVNVAAGGGEHTTVRFGHPSGTMKVGARVQYNHGRWSVTRATMSRSARVLMEGWVRAADIKQ